MDDEYEEYEEYDSPSLFSFSPMAIVFSQLKCLAISVFVLLILLWLISKVPLIGPLVSDGIKKGIGTIAEFAGVIKC